MGKHRHHSTLPPPGPARSVAGAAPPPLRPYAGSYTMSVVLPTYKVAPYLRGCIDSLLVGAPDNLEIIVVDDGSPDECGAIADEYAAADHRVRVIHQSNAGVSAARNVGFDASQSTYVAFVDPDDSVEPYWARLLLEDAGSGRPAIVKGDVRQVDINGQPGLPIQEWRAMQASTPLHWFGGVWSAIYRRDFLLRHGLRFVPGLSFEDLDFQVRALVAAMLSGEAVAVSPRAMYRHHHREGSFERSKFGSAKIAGCLRNFEGLHALLYRHQTQLPQADLGVQYHGLVSRCSGWASRAEHPADAAACRELAERIARECPVPDDMRRAREIQDRATESRRQFAAQLAAGGGPA